MTKVTFSTPLYASIVSNINHPLFGLNQVYDHVAADMTSLSWVDSSGNSRDGAIKNGATPTTT